MTTGFVDAHGSQFAIDSLVAIQDVDTLVAIQNKVSAADRELIAQKLAERANEVYDNPFKGEHNPELVQELRDSGIVRYPITMSKEACADAVSYFTNTPCYNGHVPHKGDGIARLPFETARQWGYGSYTLEQSLRCPHIIEWALNDGLLDIVGGYLGCLPTLYSINTFWTFPKENVGLTHDFHRDEDDYRFLAVFIYWTDVTFGEGEFYFIPRTHDRVLMDRFITNARRKLFGRAVTLRGIRNFDEFRHMNRRTGGTGYGNGKVYERLFSKDVLMFDGPTGTSFISDTFGLHRGSLPSTRPRLATWIRFGLYANEAYNIDRTHPVRPNVVGNRIELNERNRFICRLIISDDA